MMNQAKKWISFILLSALLFSNFTFVNITNAATDTQLDYANLTVDKGSFIDYTSDADFIVAPVERNYVGTSTTSTACSNNQVTTNIDYLGINPRVRFYRDTTSGDVIVRAHRGKPISIVTYTFSEPIVLSNLTIEWVDFNDTIGFYADANIAVTPTNTTLVTLTDNNTPNPTVTAGAGVDSSSAVSISSTDPITKLTISYTTTVAGATEKKITIKNSTSISCPDCTSPSLSASSVISSTETYDLSSVTDAGGGTLTWYASDTSTTALTSTTVVPWVYYASFASDGSLGCRIPFEIKLDSDGDGVEEITDLDSDNDGILDTSEKYCDQTTAPNGDFSTQRDSTGNATTPGAYAKQLLFFNFDGITIDKDTDVSTIAIPSITHNGITYTAEITDVDLSGAFRNSGGTPSQIVELSGKKSTDWSTNNMYYHYSFEDDSFKEALYTNTFIGSMELSVKVSAEKDGTQYPVEVVVFDAETVSKQSDTDYETLKITTTGTSFKELETWGASPVYGTDTVAGNNTQELIVYNTDTNHDATNAFGGLWATTGKEPTIEYELKRVGGVTASGIGFAVRIPCDFDGDSIPNYLDLDSDDDWCPDALEGNSALDYSDLNTDTSINSTIDTDGQPTPTASGIGTSQDASQQADSCSDTCNTSHPNFVDTDGDWVGDACDLDNDNDGILDADEMYCDANPVWATPDGDTVSGTGKLVNQLLYFNFDGVEIPNGWNYTQTTTHNGVDYTATISDISGTRTGTQASNGGVTGTINYTTFEKLYKAPNLLYRRGLNYYIHSDNPVKVSVKLTAEKDGVSYPVEAVVLDGHPSYHQRWTDNGILQADERTSVTTSGTSFQNIDVWSNGGLTTDLADIATGNNTKTVEWFNSYNETDGTGVDYRNASFVTRWSDLTLDFTSTITGNDANGNPVAKFSVQGIFFAIRLPCDTDNDGIPNYLDADSDNDGCVDALEGAWDISTDNVESGKIVNDSGDVEVDSDGVPTTANGGQAVGVSQEAGKIEITTEPTDQTVSVGDDATFSIDATATKTTTFDAGTPDYTAGEEDTISYTWYVSTDDGTTWDEISGETSESLTLSSVSVDMDGNQYKSVMTCSANTCETESTVATLTIHDPSMTLTKVFTSFTDVDADGVNGNARDTISYTFTVENTGNTNLTGISISDAKISNISCEATELAPDETTTCTGDAYTITQDDVEAGEVENTATMSAKDPSGNEITDVSDNGDEAVDSDSDGDTTNDPTITKVPQIGDYTMKKEVSATEISGPTTLTYTFTFENTGTRILENLTVIDANIDTDSLTCNNDTDSDGDIDTLAPKSTQTCTATKTITQTMIDAGDAITNTATSSATDRTGASVAEDDTADDNSVITTIIQTPQIILTKKMNEITDVDGDNNLGNAGDTISYTFTVENTGNLTLTTISVSDNKVTNITCEATELAPDESTTCTGDVYTITQADVDAGEVENTATVTAKDPSGSEITDVSDNGDETVDADNDGDATNDPTVTPVPQNASYNMTKTVDTEKVATSGTVLTYTFTFKNTGIVTLTDLTVEDNDIDAGSLACATDTDSDGDIDTLAPQATQTCTATYTVTQADIDAEAAIVNTATPQGVSADGSTLVENDTTDNTATTQVNKKPTAENDEQTIVEDETATGNVLTNDSDADGTELTLTGISIDTDGDGVADDVPVGTATTLTDADGNTIGTLTINADGSYTFTPAENWSGSMPQATYTVADEDGITTTATLDITVTPVNDVPEATNDTGTVAEDETLEVEAADGLLANDSDLDGDELTLTTASVIIDGQEVTITIGTATSLEGYGTVTIHADGSYSFTPVENFTGNVPTISYTIADEAGATATADLDITVTPVNDTPTIDTRDTTITKGTILDLTTLVNSANDVEDGDLTGSVTIADDGGFDANTPGTYTITYTVTDSDGSTATTTSTITVVTDEVPIIETHDINITEGDSLDLLTLVDSSTDTEDGDITNSVTVADDGGFDANTPGVYTITYTVTDSNGNTVTETATVTVLAPEKRYSGTGGTVEIPEDDINVTVVETNIPETPLTEVEEEPEVQEESEIEPEKVEPLPVVTPVVIDALAEQMITEGVVQQAQLPELWEPIAPMHVEKGESAMIQYPTMLPQTGTQEDIYAKAWLSSKASGLHIDTLLPAESIFRLAGDTNIELSHWLEVLPDMDRTAEKYIVLPSQGLVMPVNTVWETSESYTHFVNGGNENFHSYLETGSVELPATSTRWYGEVGNKVIIGHSSFWSNDTGRYKTHFQQIIDTALEEEVWIYERTETGDYTRYVYQISASYNTKANDISVLYPTDTRTLTLITCTPIWGIAGRWIVRAEFIGN